MRRIVFLIVLTLILTRFQYAQELITTSGDSKSNANCIIDYSIGETMVETYEVENVILTQGIHQPEIIITEILYNENNNFNISLFPNPVYSHLNVEIINIQKEIKYSLISIDGQIFAKDIKLDKTESINISNLTKGSYIIQFIVDYKIIKAFKIIKK